MIQALILAAEALAGIWNSLTPAERRAVIESVKDGGYMAQRLWEKLASGEPVSSGSIRSLLSRLTPIPGADQLRRR